MAVASVIPARIIENFFSHVKKSLDPDGCWLWQGASTRDGYGTFATGERTRQGYSRVQGTHIFSYRIANGGDSVERGQHVLHKCDVKLCVNPDHLFTGTQTVNVRDMYAKGRDRAGRKGGEPRAKVDPDTVRLIRRLYESKLFSMQVLAKKFKLRPKAIASIVHYESHRNIA